MARRASPFALTMRAGILAIMSGIKRQLHAAVFFRASPGRAHFLDGAGPQFYEDLSLRSVVAAGARVRCIPTTRP
jgi:hypothetical protein